MQLIRLLVRSGRAEQAEQVLSDPLAKSALDNTPGVLAVAFLTLGKTDEAAKEYEAALAKNPADLTLLRQAVQFGSNSGRPDFGSDELQRTLKDGSGALPEDVLYARRRLPAC